MKTLIRIEEVGLFALSILMFARLEYAWWWFPALLLVPDLSMIGYAAGNRTGALVYNVFHHRALALSVYFAGIYVESPLMQLTGIIFFAHSSMDRALGYGLKYATGFKHTHLGNIG